MPPPPEPRRMRVSTSDSEDDNDDIVAGQPPGGRRRKSRERGQDRVSALDDIKLEKEELSRSRITKPVIVQRDEYYPSTTYATLPSRRHAEVTEHIQEEVYRTEQPAYLARSPTPSQPRRRPAAGTLSATSVIEKLFMTNRLKPGYYSDSEEDHFETVAFEAANRDRLLERDMDVYDDFEFNCARTTETASETSSASNTFKLEGTPTIPLEPESSWSSDVVNVYSSRYSGDAEEGGSHVVQLSLMQGLKGPSRPLFKWL